MSKKEKLLEELITAYQEYNELLGKEITDLASLAIPHGWKSSRGEDGCQCREKIEKLLNQIKEIES